MDLVRPLSAGYLPTSVRGRRVSVPSGCTWHSLCSICAVSSWLWIFVAGTLYSGKFSNHAGSRHFLCANSGSLCTKNSAGQLGSPQGSCDSGKKMTVLVDSGGGSALRVSRVCVCIRPHLGGFGCGYHTLSVPTLRPLSAKLDMTWVTQEMRGTIDGPRMSAQTRPTCGLLEPQV